MLEHLKVIVVYLLLGGSLMTYSRMLDSWQLVDRATLNSLEDVRIEKRKLKADVEYLEAQVQFLKRRVDEPGDCRVLRKQPFCSE